MEIFYVNGSFRNKNEANISVQDRGFNFSDGVYELISFKKRKIILFERHLDRLKSSLISLGIKQPFTNYLTLRIIIDKLINLNNLDNGYIYIQITRGSAKRNHIFSDNLKQNIVLFLIPERNIENIKKGVEVITSKDIRWGRCDIKSISLLPNILSKQKAHQSGLYETWQIKDKFVTEGTTSNAFIVDKEDNIRTHPKSPEILGGVTREVVISLAKRCRYKVIEKPFGMNDMTKCNEAFLTSTTVRILPVVKIDDFEINKRKIGKITQNLINKINDYIKEND